MTKEAEIKERSLLPSKPIDPVTRFSYFVLMFIMKTSLSSFHLIAELEKFFPTDFCILEESKAFGETLTKKYNGLSFL